MEIGSLSILMLKREILLLVIVLYCITAAYSAITATYTPQPSLVFKLGPDIQTANTPAGSFGSDKLVAYIGTLSISFEAADQFRRPYLDTSGFSRPYYFSGIFNTWGGGVQNTEFYIHAKTSLRSSPWRMERKPWQVTVSPFSPAARLLSISFLSAIMTLNTIRWVRVIRW